ncbi:uncharacterized protein LOC144110434 [Amblyomma americanum]
MALLTAACIVGLILLIGLTYFVMSSDTSGHKDDEDISGGGGSSGTGGSGYIPRTKKSTSSGSTVNTSTEAETSMATRRSTTTTGPVKRVRMTCTFGASGVDIAMVPPDGLCDYIFYTDVHYNVKRRKIMPTHGKKAFEALKEAAKTYNMTTMGTSMALGTIGYIVRNETLKLLRAMLNIFDEKFVHFGMLNIDRTDEDFAHIKGTDLDYLWVVRRFLLRQPLTPEYHCAIGMGVTKKYNAQALADVALKAVKTFPRISMVILKIHIGKAFYLNDTYPAPPNPDYDDFTGLHFMNLNNTASILPSLASITEGGRLLMLSLAMYARASRMRDDFDLKTITLANKTTLIDYAAACGCSGPGKCVSKDYPRDLKFKSTTLKMWVNRTLVMFDTPAQMAQKARRRLDLLVPKHSFGVALYHVEMDDPTGVCGKEFERLHAVKDAVSEYTP